MVIIFTVNVELCLNQKSNLNEEKIVLNSDFLFYNYYLIKLDFSIFLQMIISCKIINNSISIFNKIFSTEMIVFYKFYSLFALFKNLEELCYIKAPYCSLKEKAIQFYKLFFNGEVLSKNHSSFWDNFFCINRKLQTFFFKYNFL